MNRRLLWLLEQPLLGAPSLLAWFAEADTSPE